MFKIFNYPRLVFALIVLPLLLLAGCGADEPSPTPTRYPTRAIRVSNQPTKVARLILTNTPKPTPTPRPPRTPIPTETDAPPPTDTPVVKNTRVHTAAALSAGAERAAPATSEPTATPTADATYDPLSFEPLAANLNSACNPTAGGDYGQLGANGGEGRAPAGHPDLNLAVRGYKLVNELRQLVDYDGQTDGNSPQLWGLFADRRTPVIAHTFDVYDWDWGSNTRGGLITDFPVTMTGFQVSPGETIFTPDFGKQLGEGYVALVLYADQHRITLKYTGEDNVVNGYTLQLEGVCVYSNLLNLYNARQADGRGSLPALRPGQPIGFVPTAEVGVVIRDRGSFLDPRSRKDWWRGR